MQPMNTTPPERLWHASCSPQMMTAMSLEPGEWFECDTPLSVIKARINTARHLNKKRRAIASELNAYLSTDGRVIVIRGEPPPVAQHQILRTIQRGPAPELKPAMSAKLREEIGRCVAAGGGAFIVRGREFMSSIDVLLHRLRRMIPDGWLVKAYRIDADRKLVAVIPAEAGGAP